MIHAVLFSWTIHFPVVGGGSGVVGTDVVEAGVVVVGVDVEVEVGVVEVVEVVEVIGLVVVVEVGVGADVLVSVVGIITGICTVSFFSVDSFLVDTCTFKFGLKVVVFNFWSAFDSGVVPTGNGFISFSVSVSSPAVKIIHT